MGESVASIQTIDGTWVGKAHDETGDAEITLTITTSDGEVSGTALVTDEEGGEITCEVGGRYTEGSFGGFILCRNDNCQTHMTVHLRLAGNQLSGTYSGNNTCLKKPYSGTMKFGRGSAH